MAPAQTDKRVKPHVRAAAQEVEKQFGIANIGGFASSGHIPGSDHYVGLAIDVMTSIKGQQLANWAVANAKRLSVKYVIWNRHIYNIGNSRGWVPYTGSSPHTDHVHISFYPTPGDGSAPVGNDAGGETSGAVTDARGCLMKLLDLVNPLA